MRRTRRANAAAAAVVDEYDDDDDDYDDEDEDEDEDDDSYDENDDPRAPTKDKRKASVSGFMHSFWSSASVSWHFSCLTRKPPTSIQILRTLWGIDLLDIMLLQVFVRDPNHV